MSEQSKPYIHLTCDDFRALGCQDNKREVIAMTEEGCCASCHDDEADGIEAFHSDRFEFKDIIVNTLYCCMISKEKAEAIPRKTIHAKALEKYNAIDDEDDEEAVK